LWSQEIGLSLEEALVGQAWCRQALFLSSFHSSSWLVLLLFPPLSISARRNLAGFLREDPVEEVDAQISASGSC
jgi:hypothetical protein